MSMRILLCLGLLAFVQPAFAENTSPFFGSATQAPVQITINPKTGYPVAAAETANPTLAVVE